MTVSAEKQQTLPKKSPTGIGFGIINYMPGIGRVKTPVTWLRDHGNGFVDIVIDDTGEIREFVDRRHLNLRYHNA